MPMPVKVTGKRVRKDAVGCKPIDGMGFVADKFPEDGYVITMHLPGIPDIYVRDSDLKILKSSKDENDLPLLTWEGEN